VIFHQDRMGRGFKRFRLYKLRTMNLHGAGAAYTLGADPRITSVGRWLRRYKIDELPQLWNVLRGDMSMVGPRPVVPGLATEFDRAYAKLLAVRPGLTDPASIKYCNETEILESVLDAERHFKTVITPDKIRISLAYLERDNPWTDLSVVIRTALVLVSSRLRQELGQPVPMRLERAARISFRSRTPAARKTEAAFEGGPPHARFEVPARMIENSKLIHAVTDRDSWSA